MLIETLFVQGTPYLKYVTYDEFQKTFIYIWKRHVSGPFPSILVVPSLSRGPTHLTWMPVIHFYSQNYWWMMSGGLAFVLWWSGDICNVLPQIPPWRSSRKAAEQAPRILWGGNMPEWGRYYSIIMLFLNFIIICVLHCTILIITGTPNIIYWLELIINKADLYSSLSQAPNCQNAS